MADNPFDAFDDSARPATASNPFDALDDDAVVQKRVAENPDLQAVMSRFARSRVDDISATARRVPDPEAFTSLDERTRGKAVQGELQAAEEVDQRAQAAVRDAQARGDSATYGAAVEAASEAGRRLAQARKLDEDNRAGIVRQASPEQQLAIGNAIAAQKKRIDYLNDQIEQADSNPAFLPEGRRIEDVRADLQREMQALYKLEAGRGYGEQRQAFADPSAVGEFGRGVARGALGTVPEMLGGAAKQAGADGVADVLRDFGRGVRRDTAAEAAGEILKLGEKESFGKDLKNFVSAKFGEGLGTSLPIIAAYMAGGPAGTVTGVSASAALGIGQMRNSLEDAFAEQGIAFPEEHAARYVYLYGTAIGALESLTEVTGMRALTGDAKRQAVRSIGRALASGAARGAAMEGVTEALQEAVEMYGVSDATGKPLDPSELRRRMTEGLVAGAIPGAAFGAFTGVASNKSAFDVALAKAKELGFGDAPQTPQNGQVAPEAATPAVLAETPPAVTAEAAQATTAEAQPTAPLTVDPVVAEQSGGAVLDVLDSIIADDVEIDREMVAGAAQSAADAVGVEVDPIPEAGSFADDEIASIVDMWSYVQDMAKAPRPKGIVEFMRDIGGVVDGGRDVRSQMGGANQRPGLVSKNGMALDEAALRAYEAGFFTERPTVAEFLDALDRDQRGDPVVRQQDIGYLDDYRVAQDMRGDLERLGVASARSAEDVRRYLNPRVEGASGSRTASRAKGSEATKRDLDAYLAEGGSLAKSATPGLAKRLGVTEADLPALLDKAVDAGTLRKTSGGMYRRAPQANQQQATPSVFRQAERERQALEAIDEALKLGRQILPKGVNVTVKDELNVSGYELDAYSETREGHIALALLANNPKARLGHEGLHTLVTRGHVSPGELAILAETARTSGVWTAKAEAQYRDAYAGRANLDGLIAEEAAAHLVEARIRGQDFGQQANAIIEKIKKVLQRIRKALQGRGFKTADDVIDALMSGEMARREARAEWMRDAQAEARQLMQARARQGVELPGGVRVQGVPLFAIRAFHGSPHDFDRFDMSKIGTGEGAQAYGHGLYFAESEGVAKSYRDKLQDVKYGGSPIDPSDPSHVARAFLESNNGDAVKAASFLRERAKNMDWELNNAAADLLEKGGQIPDRKASGRMYEVSINADPEDFLDWDKPLSEQSEKVREMFHGLSPETQGMELYRAAQGLDARERPKLTGDTMRDFIAQGWHDSGASTATKRGASEEVLKNAGIPGIRYLDQGSRTAGDGSRNYVVFDDALIEIVAKDGVPVVRDDAMFAIADAHTGRAMRSDIDALGFYSAGLRAARAWPQTKGTPEQALTWLKKSGVKEGEIEATGLAKVIEGQKAVTRDEIVAHLEKNRVGLNEVRYGEPPKELAGAEAKIDEMISSGSYDPYELRDLRDQAFNIEQKTPRTKWSSYSLDPGNPSYRETVLHLPGKETIEEYAKRMGIALTPATRRIVESSRGMDTRVDFNGGHFPEPNITGHMMTSMVRDADGRPVYLIDQIQSDWGQNLRDGGVRDEAKIAAIKRQYTAAERAYYDALNDAAAFAYKNKAVTDEWELGDFANNPLAISGTVVGLTKIDGIEAAVKLAEVKSLSEQFRLLRAELATAEASTPGHPLVNTTDQWTNTTLRRALRQAVEADADAIAIPSGKTVLSYNPGDEHGMEGFYDGIVPKNLKNILRKLDKASPDPMRVDQLDTPTQGMKGEGFTVFRLTDEVKRAVMEEGQALFSLRREGDGLDMSPEARKARAEDMGFDTSKVWYHGTRTSEIRAFDGRNLGAFFSDDPDVASSYAMAGDDAPRNVMPIYAKPGRQKIVDANGRQAVQDYDIWGEAMTARAEGYDSLLVRNVDDSHGAEIVGDVLAVFNTSNIRSVNAAFNPAKADSPNLLYGLSDVARRFLPSRNEPLAGINSIVRDLAHDLGITVRQGLTTPAAKKAKRQARKVGTDISSYYDPATGVLRVTSMADLTAILTHAGEAIIRRYDAAKGRVDERGARDVMNPLERLISRHAFGLLGTYRGKLFGQIEPTYSGTHLAPVLRETLTQYLQAWHNANVATMNRSRDPGGYAKAQRELTNAQRMVARYMGRKLTDAIAMEKASVTSVWGLVQGKVDIAEIRDYVDIRYNQHSKIKPPPPADPLDRETQRAAFGKWFTTYISDRPAAEAQDPALFEAFEDLIDTTDPVLSAKLDDASDAIAAYAKAEPVQIVTSMISSPKRFGNIASFFQNIDRDGLLPTLADGARMLYRGGWDDLHPWYTAVRQLLETHRVNSGVKIDLDAADNAYKLLRLGRHSGAWAGRDLEDGIKARASNAPEGPSLVQALQMALGSDRATALDMGQDGRYAQFNAYLIARRAVRLWDRFYDGTLPNPPLNASRETAVATIQKLEGEFPSFVGAADMVYEFQTNLLKLQRDAGILTPETFETLAKEPDYVPFIRDMTDKDEASSRVLRGAQSIIRKIKGSDRNIMDPIATIAQKVYETRQIIATNDAKLALLKLAEAAGPGGGAIAERLDPNTSKAMRVNLKDALRSAADEMGVSRADANALVDIAQELLGDQMTGTVFGKGQLNTTGQNITWVYENGIPVPIKLADGDLGNLMMQTLQTFGTETTNIIVEMMAVPAAITRSTVTSHPSFILRNGFVDGLMAWMYDRQATPWVTQAKGFVAGLMETEKVRAYARSAGLMGGPSTSALDRLRFDRDVRDLVARGYQPKVWESPAAFIGELVRHPIRNIALMSEASETGTRARLYELAYDRAIKTGLNPREAAAEAAFYAHDYMDYSRHGSTVAAWSKLVPFMNAALQGMDRYARLLVAKGDYGSAWLPYLNYRLGRTETLDLTEREKAELAQSAQAWVVSTLVMGGISMAVALLWAMRGDDDLQDVPQEIRATHWVIPLDGVYHLVPKELPGIREALKDNLDGETLRLPKGFDNAWFANLVERLMIDARQSNPRWFENYLTDLSSILNPPMEPQAIKLFYEMKAGKDFFSGRDIIPKWKQERFPEMMWDEYTSEFAKWAGKKTGTAPYYIDHALKQLGTSWARDAMSLNVPGLPWYDPTKPEKSMDDYFIARRFLWKIGKGSEAAGKVREIMGPGDPMQGVAGRLFAPYSRLDAAAETYKEYLKRRDPASGAEFLDRLRAPERAYAILDANVDGDNAKMKMVHPIHRADKVLTEVAGVQKEILGNLFESRKRKKNTGELIPLSPSEKRAAIDILTQYKMMEAHNALVVAGETGYAQRALFDTGAVMDELRAAVPDVAEEFEKRLKKAKVIPFRGVREQWPQLRQVLESAEVAALSKAGDKRGVAAKVREFYALAKTSE